MKNVFFAKAQNFFGKNIVVKSWQSLSEKDQIGFVAVVFLFIASGLINSLIQANINTEVLVEKKPNITLDLSRFRLTNPAQPQKGDLVYDITGEHPFVSKTQ